MPLIKETIEINVARMDVFRFCHDVTSRAEWDEQVLNVEMLTPPPVRTGTLLRVDASHMGSAVFSWDAEYIRFQLPQESRLRVIDTAASSPFANGSEMRWQFESVGSSTRLTWEWDYRPRGFFAAVRDKLGGHAAMQRAIRRSLAQLKSMLESGRRARIR